MRVAGRHKIDVRFDTRALSTAYRRSPKLADRDTQLRCHGGPIGGTNGRRSYASRVMPWLMPADVGRYDASGALLGSGRIALCQNESHHVEKVKARLAEWLAPRGLAFN